MKADRLLKILMEKKSFPRTLRNKKVFARFRAGLDRELHTTEYERRSIILSPGQVAREAYLVSKGLVRVFMIDSKTGEEITLFFSRRT